MVRSRNWPDLWWQISKIRDIQVVDIYDLMKRWRFETNRISSVATAQPQSQKPVFEFYLTWWPDLWWPGAEIFTQGVKFNCEQVLKKRRRCAPPFFRYPRKTGGVGIFCPHSSARVNFILSTGSAMYRALSVNFDLFYVAISWNEYTAGGTRTRELMWTPLRCVSSQCRAGAAMWYMWYVHRPAPQQVSGIANWWQPDGPQCRLPPAVACPFRWGMKSIAVSGMDACLVLVGEAEGEERRKEGGMDKRLHDWPMTTLCAVTGRAGTARPSGRLSFQFLLRALPYPAPSPISSDSVVPNQPG